MTPPPILINVFERLEYPRRMIERLHALGVDERLVLIDNGSTYEPTRDWLASLAYPVIRLEENLGPWVGDVLRSQGKLARFVKRGEHVVYSDPDVEPCEDCPPDFLDYWAALLDWYPDVAKVGFALRIDDVPDEFPLKYKIRHYEAPNWVTALDAEATAYTNCFIDTTFALVRYGRMFAWSGNCIRTAAPRWARHLTWYETPDTLTPDVEYYRSRVAGMWSCWSHHGRKHIAERL